MKTGATLYIKDILLTIVVVIISLTCTTSAPVGPDNSAVSAQLSLYYVGNVTADFTGEPITAIIQFTDSITFRELSFHTGGVFIRPDIAPNEKFTYIEVPMHWNLKTLVLPTDTLLGVQYDSIFVKIGPNLSNAVKVYVYNRAPVIDSISVADTSFAVSINIFSDNIYEVTVDTTGIIDLIISAHDWDKGQMIKASWRPLKDSALITISEDKMKATYDVPNFNFRDSVVINVFDPKNGSVELVLILIKISGPDPIKVTKIDFGDTTFTDTVAKYMAKEVDYDTVLTQIFYTSSELINVSWVASSGIITNADGTTPANEDKAVYVSTDTSDTLTTDTTITIDTVTVSLTNSVGDLTQKTIYLVKIPANLSPVIDSMLIDTVILKGQYNQVTGHRYTVLSGETINLRNYAHDPDGGGVVLTYTWKEASGIGMISDTIGNAITYTAPDSSCKDSLYAIVADDKGFTTSRKIVLTVFKNNPPVIDTIILDDTTIVPGLTDTLFFYSDSLADTFTIRINAFDLDTSTMNDSVSYLWNYRDRNLNPAVAYIDSIIYIPALTMYSDTITITVSDKYNGQDKRRIIATFMGKF